VASIDRSRSHWQPVVFFIFIILSTVFLALELAYRQRRGHMFFGIVYVSLSQKNFVSTTALHIRSVTDGAIAFMLLVFFCFRYADRTYSFPL